MTAQWDTSYIIGMAITIVLTVAFGVTAIVALIVRLRGNSPAPMSGIVAAIAAGLFVLAGGIGTYISFPWSGQYHRYVPESGTVAAVGSRFLSSDVNGGGSTQKFVVTFTDGRSYGCLDTRCANVTKGDRLTLLCERVFQFNAPHEGYDCNWGEDLKANGVTIP